jgi:hypothetical protein
MKKIALFIFILMAFINTLKAQRYFFPYGKQNAPIQTDTPQYHFPLFKSYDNVTPDTARVKHYSEQLTALNEPVIYVDRTHFRVFRFIWLRSADHPIAIRLTKQDNEYILYWKEADGTGEGKPGKLITDKQKVISGSNYGTFRKLLKQVNTCKLDTGRYIPAGTQGSQWIVEGKEGGIYEVVDMWSPAKSNALYKACDYLIGLTDLTIAPERKY